MPSLVDYVANRFPESLTINNSIDPDEVIAKGCALQAYTLVPPTATSPPAELTSTETKSSTLARPLGFKAADGSFVVLLDEATPLPARRVVEVSASKGSTKAAVLTLFEGVRSIETEAPATNGAKKSVAADEDDEDDEDDEEEPKKSVVLKAEKRIAEVAVKIEGKMVKAVVVVEKDGKGRLSASCGGEERSVAF